MQSILPDFLITPSVIIQDESLQPLDGYVFGVVYWYKHQKLEKCVASNAQIGKLLNASVSGVSHSLTRLARKNYIKVVLNEETNQREEIIPLISFTKREEIEILDSTPLHNRATPLAQNNNKTPTLNRATPLAESSNTPSSNEQQNNKNNIIRINNTVNGNESVLKKLPDLPLSRVEKQYLLTIITNVLKDNHSRSYYELVVCKVPEQKIREALSEIKQDGANSAEKVFTYKMEQYGLTQTKKI